MRIIEQMIFIIVLLKKTQSPKSERKTRKISKFISNSVKLTSATNVFRVAKISHDNANCYLVFRKDTFINISLSLRWSPPIFKFDCSRLVLHEIEVHMQVSKKMLFFPILKSFLQKNCCFCKMHEFRFRTSWSSSRAVKSDDFCICFYESEGSERTQVGNSLSYLDSSDRIL